MGILDFSELLRKRHVLFAFLRWWMRRTDHPIGDSVT